MSVPHVFNIFDDTTLPDDAGSRYACST